MDAQADLSLRWVQSHFVGVVMRWLIYFKIFTSSRFSPFQTEDKQRAVQYWGKIYNAMEMVQMTEEEIKSICSVLAAIYHLGVAGAVKG